MFGIISAKNTGVLDISVTDQDGNKLYDPNYKPGGVHGGSSLGSPPLTYLEQNQTWCKDYKIIGLCNN